MNHKRHITQKSAQKEHRTGSSRNRVDRQALMVFPAPTRRTNPRDIFRRETCPSARPDYSTCQDASASRSTPIICSSVNRIRFISPSFHRPDSNRNRMKVGGHVSGAERRAVERGEVVAAAATNWQRCSGQDRWTCAAQDRGRASRLADRAHRGDGVHPARPGRRAGDTRAQGRLPDDVEVRACARAQLQKKPCWPASRTDPTWPANGNAGRRVRRASIRTG